MSTLSHRQSFGEIMVASVASPAFEAFSAAAEAEFSKCCTGCGANLLGSPQPLCRACDEAMVFGEASKLVADMKSLAYATAPFNRLPLSQRNELLAAIRDIFAMAETEDRIENEERIEIMDAKRFDGME